MPISDYAHWNEDAQRVWWEEEGRHSDEPDYNPDDYLADLDTRDDALDAFYEEADEMDDDELLAMLADTDYCARWPQAAKCIRNILADRGVTP